jgi:hypothetical protein
MSDLDSELLSLRARLSALEEQKRIEQEKKLYPMNNLKEIIDTTKTGLEKGGTSQGYWTIRGDTTVRKGTPLVILSYEKDKLEFLEQIYLTLNNMNKRLDALERLIS